MGGVLKAGLIGEAPTLDLHATTAVITQQITWHMYETLYTYDKNLNPDPDAGREARRRRQRAPVHHHAPQGRALPQRQGDDLGRRRVVAPALGQAGHNAQGGLEERRGARGQGSVHHRHLSQGAVRLAPLRAGLAEQRRGHLSEGGRGGRRRRPGQGVHRHRALSLRRAQARPARPPGALQGVLRSLRAAQRLWRQAHGVHRRDLLHPGARGLGAPGRGRDRRVQLRPEHPAGPDRSRQGPAGVSRRRSPSRTAGSPPCRITRKALWPTRRCARPSWPCSTWSRSCRRASATRPSTGSTVRSSTRSRDPGIRRRAPPATTRRTRPRRASS